MPLRIIRGGTLPIGVDLGSFSLKMAQLRYVNQGLDLLAADSTKIPTPCRNDSSRRMEFLSHSIHTILKSKTFTSRQCVLSLPASDTYVQHVKIPRLPAQDIPKALQWELRGKLPFDVEEAVIRHIVAGETFGDGEAKQEVIVVAASKSVLNACLTMVHRAKLAIVGINIEPCADDSVRRHRGGQHPSGVLARQPNCLCEEPLDGW